MKGIIVLSLIAVFFSTSSCYGQNLVPNPSFEDYSSCPNGQWQIDKSLGWATIRNSPDYFNVCSQSSESSVPSNSLGFQYPSSTNCSAYAGIITYSGLINSYREYFGTQLTVPLTIGQKYFVSFKTVLAAGVYGASNNIGTLFTTQQVVEGSADPITNLSHVHATNVITDTVNWITVFGSFIADSAYSFIKIGNFYNDTNTVLTNVNGTPYYFIDDVCVATDSVFCMNYVYSCTTGINEDFRQVPTLSPNPTNGLLFLKWEENFSIKILGEQGNNLFECNNGSNCSTIDVSFLPSGLYYLSVFTSTERFNSKIIIIH